MKDTSQSSQQQTQCAKRPRETWEVQERKMAAIQRRSIVESLRPAQRDALRCLQETELSALIVLPTGSGKTTLMWTFKEPGKCSIICAPYKYLVEQLLDLVKDKGKALQFPFEHVEGDGGCIYATLATVDFILIPFEMAPTAADLLWNLQQLDRLGTMWIDEVSIMNVWYVTSMHSMSDVFQVHVLCSRGRFRESLDSFWDLQASLLLKGVTMRMIGLTATLRPDDVEDIMRRISISKAIVFRQSCFRENHQFVFDRTVSDQDAVNRASAIAVEVGKQEKVLVFTSTVRLCDDVYAQIQASFQPG